MFEEKVYGTEKPKLLTDPTWIFASTSGSMKKYRTRTEFTQLVSTELNLFHVRTFYIRISRKLSEKITKIKRAKVVQSIEIFLLVERI